MEEGVSFFLQQMVDELFVPFENPFSIAETLQVVQANVGDKPVSGIADLCQKGVLSGMVRSELQKGYFMVLLDR